ncbi:MAG: ATP-dependent DNA helicase [Candidatus Nanopelagicales bacterium]|nr:ATP-dependent DNA helicase [Candidatus Nanopelagicales bacterium]
MTAAITRVQLDRVLGFAVSDEQWQIISAPLEPSVVVAGAGSGKTTSMAARVAWLVGSDLVTADRVLGLTFTNKAAASLGATMRGTLRALSAAGHLPPAPDDSADDEADAEPQVQTYNAFAARILRDHGIRIGREPGARVLTDGARQQLAFRVVCSTTLPLDALDKGPDGITVDLLALDDQCSELGIEPLALVDWDDGLVHAMNAIERSERLQNNGQQLRATAQKRRLLARLVVEWRAAKERHDVLDYTDQTRLALELVRRFPDVAATLRAQHAAVLLDEYQDTSIAQRQLLQALFADGHAVTAVGDPCQAIYGWRGASVDNIEQFPQHFPAVRQGAAVPAARYTLSANRRSGPNILAVANALSADLRQRHAGIEELTWADTGKGPGDVAVGLFEHVAQERDWIVARIRELGADPRIAWGQIAILATTGRELAQFDAALQGVGVPTQLHGAAGLLSQPIVVEVRSMLEAVADPVANPAVVRLLTGPRWALGPRDLAGLGARAAELAGTERRPEAHTVADALDDAVAGADPVEMTSLSDAILDPGDPARFSPQALARLTSFGAELRQLRRHASEPLVEFLGRVVRSTGLDVELALAPAQQRLAWLTFVEFAAEFTDLDGRSSLGAFLRRLRDAERFDIDLSIDVVQRTDAVQLMTVHKAKGLEFPHVFVPGFVDGAFPGGPARGQWPGTASAVPWHVRPDATDDLRSYPVLDRSPKATEFTAYQGVLQELQHADHQRLAYVALTRAERTLVVTGHWWGPTQQRRREPGAFLEQVRTTCLDGAGVIAHWHPEPDAEVRDNPFLEHEGGVPWPAPVESRTVVRDLHARIQQPASEEPLGLTDDETRQLADLDDAAAALLAEARRLRAPVVQVALPSSISASVLMRAMRDPEGLAADLARPMPAPSSAASARGTAFHAWVETQYGQQSLLDPDDLPGASDHDIVSDADLDELREAFAATAFAAMTPVAVEQSFAIVLGGRVVRGRIDAVFAVGDRFDVIDWKTGSAASADPLQLALYRLAWSRIAQVPLDAIDAGFLLVRTGEVLRPDLPELAALSAVTQGAEAPR